MQSKPLCPELCETPDMFIRNWARFSRGLDYAPRAPQDGEALTHTPAMCDLFSQQVRKFMRHMAGEKPVERWDSEELDAFGDYFISTLFPRILTPEQLREGMVWFMREAYVDRMAGSFDTRVVNNSLSDYRGSVMRLRVHILWRPNTPLTDRVDQDFVESYESPFNYGGHGSDLDGTIPFTSAHNIFGVRPSYFEGQCPIGRWAAYKLFSRIFGSDRTGWPSNIFTDQGMFEPID